MAETVTSAPSQQVLLAQGLPTYNWYQSHSQTWGEVGAA